MGRPKSNLSLWYCGLRFTLADEQDAAHICEQLVTVILGNELERQMFKHTIGSERGWKSGKAHIHFHFESLHTDSNLRKTVMKRFMKTIGDTRTLSNAVYSVKTLRETDVDNLDRFFRYPLKECGLLHADLCTFPSNWTGDNSPVYMAKLAEDEMNNKLRDIAKTEARDELKEKRKTDFVEHMINLNAQKPFKDIRSIYIETLKYYNEENESINPQHSWGKVLHFAVRFGVTTIEDIADRELSKRW